MLEVIGLTCSRNDRVLFKNLSFEVKTGTGLQINAANGAGKTTLLKIIAGLLPASHGEVHASAAIFYLGHKQNIDPALSALHNLQYLHTLNSAIQSINSNTESHFKDALTYVNLIAQQHILCGQLSAGQQHRVNLARLYLATAKIWLLDEPFANIDLLGQSLLLELFTKHLAAGGIILLASHTIHSLPLIQSIELSEYA